MHINNANTLNLLVKNTLSFVIVLYLDSYSRAQFKLDSARVQQGHNTTRFSFHTCARLSVHARLVTYVNPTVHSSRVCTRCVHDVRMHVRNAHAKFGLHVHANYKPRIAE